MKYLVTGGLGYIGSHMVALLADHGHEIHVVDDLINNENYDFVKDRATFLTTSPLQRRRRDLSNHYDVVVHLAAYISVEESVRQPRRYWVNNLEAMMGLEACTTDHLIFASTGTAFNPTNPYARTKVACENYIQDVFNARLNESECWFNGFTTFRFYNVSGLRPGILPTGQPTHLIRICAEAARGIRSEVKVFGTDYETRDGTAVRDYIHVEDIVGSIYSAVQHGPSNTPFECLGTGTGSTVLEVVQAMKEVSGTDFKVTLAGRRPGDDAVTICPSQYKHIQLTKTLGDMCLSAFENLEGN